MLAVRSACWGIALLTFLASCDLDTQQVTVVSRRSAGLDLVHHSQRFALEVPFDVLMREAKRRLEDRGGTVKSEGPERLRVKFLPGNDEVLDVVMRPEIVDGGYELVLVIREYGQASAAKTRLRHLIMRDVEAATQVASESPTDTSGSNAGETDSLDGGVADVAATDPP